MQRVLFAYLKGGLSLSLDEELRTIGVKTSEARRLEAEGKISEAVELLTQISQQLRELAQRADAISLRDVLLRRSEEYASDAALLKQRYSAAEREERAAPEQQGVAKLQLLRGCNVALQLLQLLQSAQYRVLIAVHQIHDVEGILGQGNTRLNLLSQIIRIRDGGVKVRVITTPPSQLSGVARWRQTDALRRLAEKGIEFRLCSRIHFNFVLVDDTGLWRGTAPLTSNGLSGLNDLVELSSSRWLMAVYLDIFRARWERGDISCTQCRERTCMRRYQPEDVRRSMGWGTGP